MSSGGRYLFFFFNDTATTEIYTLSLHDALPILYPNKVYTGQAFEATHQVIFIRISIIPNFSEELTRTKVKVRSEEHTSELQSRQYLVCRLLLEKNNSVPSPDRRLERYHRRRPLG